MLRVKTPDGIGKTDGVRTYCCEATPSWFVIFPGDFEGHYYHVRDCKVIVSKETTARKFGAYRR